MEQDNNTPPDIRKFSSVYRTVTKLWYKEMRPTVRYRAKIDTHGVSVGVQINPDGEVFVQDIYEKGFKGWVAENKDYWSSLAKEDRIVVFGVWLEDLSFSVECVLFNGQSFLIDPVMIEKVFGDDRPDKIDVLQWFDEEVSFDFMSKETLRQSYKKVHKITETVDLWSAGHGAIFYPVNVLDDPNSEWMTLFDENATFKVVNRRSFERFIFKQKSVL